LTIHLNNHNTMSNEVDYLESARQRLLSYKKLGDETLERLNEEQLHWRPDDTSNSIYLIVKHLNGNMLSRWTDFLTSDGEKPWRQRDNEFEEAPADAAAIKALWEEGWARMMDTLNGLQEADLPKTVYIRSEPHSAMDAINRQLCHIPYHVGQIVFVGKMLLKGQWKSLSIPKGQSEQFNKKMSR
jgi:hypothetical protein